MPRLDAERIALWRRFQRNSADVRRRIDAELVAQHDVSLAWFEVLSTIRDAGGSMRVGELCEQLAEVPSSLSRRLDRMEAGELISRQAAPAIDDRRAVIVAIEREGREIWRDANITYRRMVQDQFARSLTDTDIAALHRILGKLAP